MQGHAWGLVFDGAGRLLHRQEFPLPTLGQDGLLVEITARNLCGTLLHTYEGRRTTPCPTILGHEIIGRIAALPDDTPRHDFAGLPLRVGDRVVWTIAASCGRCFYCTHQLPQK